MASNSELQNSSVHHLQPVGPDFAVHLVHLLSPGHHHLLALVLLELHAKQVHQELYDYNSHPCVYYNSTLEKRLLAAAHPLDSTTPRKRHNGQ